MAIATTTRIAARARNGWSATSLSAMTMISADRMKSVLMAPETTVCSSCGRGGGRAVRLVAAHGAPDLLEALVAEVRRAEHEQRGDHPVAGTG